MKYEFNSKKYITKGIAETLLPELQLFLFSCIDTMRIKTDGQLDYLQVFRLETVTENNISLLHICHEQEQPECSMKYILSTDTIINCKIFVIDDVDHVTMLLAEEY